MGTSPSATSEGSVGQPHLHLEAAAAMSVEEAEEALCAEVDCPFSSIDEDRIVGFATSDRPNVDGMGEQGTEQGSELGELLDRVRRGNRDASAEFIKRYGPRIRRRVRGKLSPAMRRLFDSQEILATVARRLDQMVASGRLRAVSDGQVWSLVFTIADRSLIEKAKLFRSLQAKEGEDSPLALSILRRLKQAEQRDPDGPELEIDKVLQSLGDRADRQILGLWLMGRGASSIAAAVDMEPATVRKRWERIRSQLRDACSSDSDERST